jgi:hypothetical protein
MGLIEHSDVTNPRHHDAAAALRQCDQSRVSFHAVDSGQPNLDQFVIVERSQGLGNHGIGEAGIAHQDHWFKGVRQAFQMPALFFGKLHGSIMPKGGLEPPPKGLM